MNALTCDQPTPQHGRHERQVLFPPGGELADREINRAQTEPDHAAGVVVLHRHQAALPICRQDRRLGSDAVRVVAERFVERRFLADGTVDQICLLRCIERVSVRFGRDGQFSGRLRETAQNRLAADDDELRVSAMLPAARMMGSRSDRLTVGSIDFPALLRRQDAAERVALAQPLPQFRLVEEQRPDFLPWPPQDLQPLAEGRQRTLFKPALTGGLGSGQPRLRGVGSRSILATMARAIARLR